RTTKMLATRLVFGLMMVAGLMLALWVDEWFSPWFPVWFLLAASTLVAAAWELCQLLNATSARPSANSVVGGVLALLIANWVPHLAEGRSPQDGASALLYSPARPVEVLSWPFLAFVAVLMTSFVVQSLQFTKPGRTLAKIASTVLAIAYVGLLGSFTI